jgi:hypothetical protein
MKSDSPCPSYQFVWRNFVIPRVKFFGSLLTKGRINCKSNLLNKRVLQDDTCDICGQSSETPDHIISGCPFAQSFWSQVGWGADNISKVHCLWESVAPIDMPRVVHSSLLLLICWEIWKHRHDVVFRNMPPNHHRLIAACRESARQWRCRLPRNDTRLCSFWCNSLPI